MRAAWKALGPSATTGSVKQFFKTHGLQAVAVSLAGLWALLLAPFVQAQCEGAVLRHLEAGERGEAQKQGVAGGEVLQAAAGGAGGAGAGAGAAAGDQAVAQRLGELRQAAVGVAEEGVRASSESSRGKETRPEGLK